jgi:hypothetical protein
LGRVDVATDEFISVLGQTVFIDGLSGIGTGSLVAIYGSIDVEGGGIVNASVVDARSAGFADDTPSFLTGIVDSVDHASGKAVVSGMAVDYSALLAVGSAPDAGYEVSVTGHAYADMGLLVADPQMQLEVR